MRTVTAYFSAILSHRKWM